MSESATLPDNWELVRLADHTTVKARLGWKGLKAEEYVEDGYIFLATPNLKSHQIDFDNVNYITKWRYDESPEIQLHVGDVLIVKDGSTLGISNFVRHLPRPTTVNGSIAVVRTRSSLHPEFLYHLVNGQAFQYLIASKKAGLGVPHLFQADLREFFVALPPVRHQRKIARILTTLDNVITQTEALIAKYQAIKQGLMHDLFTRGVDATGTLRPPQSEAPELYKQSGLGWIPKEWEVEYLGDFISHIDSGWSPVCDPNPAGSGEVGSLKTTSITWNGFDPAENKRLPTSLSPRPETFVEKDDILVTRVGPRNRIGIVAHVAEATGPLMVSDNMLRIRLHTQNRLAPQFIPLLTSSQLVQSSWDRRKVGLAEAQMVMTQRVVRETRLPIPPAQEQVRIMSAHRSISSKIGKENLFRGNVVVLKTGLMQDLLTGKVPVQADEADEVTASA
jgi:type I restriction enzyme S subunit